MDKKLDVIFGILGMSLYISPPHFESGRSGCRVCKRAVKSPYPIMLGGRKGPECPVECAPRKSEERLLHQELQVHLPYSRHFVQEDQGALKEGIDLAEFGRKYRGIQLADMLSPEVEILNFELVRRKTSFGVREILPSSITCMIVEVGDKPVPGQSIALEVSRVGF